MEPQRLHVHTSVQPIRWADMDALGHVNNAVYFRYMEQARIDWIHDVTRETGGYETGQGPVIVNASCTFREQLRFPGNVEIRMYLGELGRTSVGSFYDLHIDGRVIADGAARIVWINLATGRPTPLPAHVAEPLRKLRGARAAT